MNGAVQAPKTPAPAPTLAEEAVGSHPSLLSALLMSEACLGRDAARRNGLPQGVVVALVLVGVGLRE